MVVLGRQQTLRDAEGDVACAAGHVQALERPDWMQLVDERVFPQAMHAAAHEVVHDVIAARESENQSFLESPRTRGTHRSATLWKTEATMGFFSSSRTCWKPKCVVEAEEPSCDPVEKQRSAAERVDWAVRPHRARRSWWLECMATETVIRATRGNKLRLAKVATR